jgi:O-methyltransferase involved in polyketide biosynthesis
LRVLAFDREVRRFLAAHPGGTVVSLGEGLETSTGASRWMDEVDASRGLLITAQRLFMYFEFEAVERLLDACAKRFRGSAAVFDAVPRWLSEASRVPPLRRAFFAILLARL